MDTILQAIKSLFRKAENAVSQTASALYKRINVVSLAANNAQTTANNAQTAAANAQTTANNAQTTANAAKTAAANAQTTANNAQTAANSKMNSKNPVGSGSFSMGRKSGTPVGSHSHAEGYTTTASGSYSHAEGNTTTASGICSHAEGFITTASGDYSHAEGFVTTASGDYSHAEGKYNIVDQNNKYAHIVGNGTSTADTSNAHTLDWSGVPWYQGRPQFGGNAQDDGAQLVMANGDTEIILTSSTEGSAKQFKITVDDSGTITATEVTA